MNSSYWSRELPEIQQAQRALMRRMARAVTVELWHYNRWDEWCGHTRYVLMPRFGLSDEEITQRAATQAAHMVQADSHTTCGATRTTLHTITTHITTHNNDDDADDPFNDDHHEEHHNDDDPT